MNTYTQSMDGFLNPSMFYFAPKKSLAAHFRTLLYENEPRLRYQRAPAIHRQAFSCTNCTIRIPNLCATRLLKCLSEFAILYLQGRDKPTT